ncbi:MAG: o-succinylbenzoate synthase [Chlamydiales bacterium]|nr:o-succinylbenzoate synthase [Chlamydiales bacterium]
MLKLYSYSLPVKGFPRREGLILELTTEDGRTSFGEVAPLPGWSLETLEEAHAQLINLSAKTPLLPSVAFGIESTKLPSPSLPLKFPISSLLVGSFRQIMNKAERCAREGVTSVKLKLSTLSEEEASSLIRTLKNTFSLRIDLNRAWSLDKSLKFFSEFSPEDFDYIEEPCSRIEDLFHFPLPLAVDESLREAPLEYLLKIPQLKALIFKPTLQGGFKMGKLLAEAAKRHNLDLIFSSSFESGVGISQIALLAHALDLPIKPLGLDTYSFLEEDILVAPLGISSGILTLNQPPTLNKERLHVLSDLICC